MPSCPVSLLVAVPSSSTMHHEPAGGVVAAGCGAATATGQTPVPAGSREFAAGKGPAHRADPRPDDIRLTAPAATAAPHLDGRIDEAEWKGAAEIDLGSGITAMALEHDGVIYFAVRGAGPTIVTIALAAGGQVHVLHASASLGRGV